MPQKRHTVDQIVAKLRKADVELGKGKIQDPSTGIGGGKGEVHFQPPLDRPRTAFADPSVLASARQISGSDSAGVNQRFRLRWGKSAVPTPLGKGHPWPISADSLKTEFNPLASIYHHQCFPFVMKNQRR